MYTPALTEQIIKEYKAGVPIARVASNAGKSEKSVIAKLSTLKVYIKTERPSKITGDKPKTKAAFVKDICNYLNTKELPGLDKAPKTTLIKICDLLSQLDQDLQV